MIGGLRMRANQAGARPPQLTKSRRRRSVHAADNQLYLQAVQTTPARASMQTLQRACGNQAVCRMVQAQMEETSPGKKKPALENMPKHPPAEEPLRLVFWGATARPVPSLEEDSHLAEARKNGMREVLAWEQRGSERLLRTTEQSAEFYRWLAKRVDKFPGARALGENQYWAIDPVRGRLWLCTLHVVPAEEQSREENVREQARAERAALPGAEQARGRGQAALAGAAGTGAAYMNAISLLPFYLSWLYVGGKRSNPQLMIPASWYLKKTDPSQWNLIAFLGIRNFARLMEEQAYRQAVNARVFGSLASSLGAATGQKLPLLTGHEMDVLDALKAQMEQSGMPPLQIQMLLSTLPLTAVLTRLPKVNEAIRGNNMTALTVQTEALFAAVSAFLSVQFAGIAEQARGGKDDSGFWVACAKSDLQRQYFQKRLLGDGNLLQYFLKEMNIKDSAVYEAIRRLVSTIAGELSPSLRQK